MRAVQRGFVAIITIAVTAWSATAAVRTGMAQTVLYGASSEAASWAASGVEPGAQTVSWVREDLERAARWAPRDASIQELLGELAIRRRERADRLDEALDHFRRALVTRPSSPYTWADVAAADYLKGDTGPGFEQALRSAAELGPAEPEVQRTVVDLGLAVWNEVSESTRVAVERMVSGGMRRNPLETLQIAERRGRLAVACRHWGDAPRHVDPRWSEKCLR